MMSPLEFGGRERGGEKEREIKSNIFLPKAIVATGYNERSVSVKMNL